MQLTEYSDFPAMEWIVRSAYSAGLVLNVEEFGLRDCAAADFPWDWFHRMILEAKRLRPYFYGDYYPLTPCIVNLDAWMAYQLVLPDKQEGVLLAFRRAESPINSACFQLHGLDAAKTYEIEDADGGKTWLSGGQELAEKGLAISIATPRTSRLLFYSLRRKESANKSDAGDA